MILNHRGFPCKTVTDEGVSMEFHLLVFIPPTSTPTKVKWFGITRRGNTHENLNASLRSPLLYKVSNPTMDLKHPTSI